MIPDGSTPIKNEILIDIFAKRKLSYPEMSIAFYIIRWSWGFNGAKRRQDYTKKLTKRQIATDINMKESQLNKIINRMITENKLIVKDNCYQFNEHYENWKLNGELSFEEENLTGSEVKLNGELNKLNRELNKLNGELSSTDLKPLQDKPLPDRKETLKETLIKKQIKKTLSQTYDKFDQVYQLTIYLEGKIMENNKAVIKREESQIQSWCKDMDKLIRIDKAKSDEIRRIIDWVTEDKFWSKNILCPASLRKHYPRFWKEVIDRGKSLDESIINDHRFDDINWEGVKE